MYVCMIPMRSAHGTIVSSRVYMYACMHIHKKDHPIQAKVHTDLEYMHTCTQKITAKHRPEPRSDAATWRLAVASVATVQAGIW
jgi:hypothetical protein